MPCSGFSRAQLLATSPARTTRHKALRGAWAYHHPPPEVPSSMPFSLLQLNKSALQALAASRIPQGLEGRFEQGAMPPAFVAVRSLELAAAGHALPWSTTFLIVNDEDARIVGGCGFKTVPQDGRVEIGYGVAPAARGKGAASAALRVLLRKALEAGATELVAEVAPANGASTRVVQKAGFERAGARIDADGEHVVQWVKRIGPGDFGQTSPSRADGSLACDPAHQL
jgi:ribosomal-protein-alanine N-acetyltransferase